MVRKVATLRVKFELLSTILSHKRVQVSYALREVIFKEECYIVEVLNLHSRV